MPPMIRWLWLTLALVAACVLATKALGAIALPLVLGGLGALGLQPVVRFLEHRGVPHGFAVLLTLLGVVLTVVAATAVVIPPLAQQASALSQALPGAARRLTNVGARWDRLSQQLSFLPPLPELTQWLAGRTGNYVRGMLGWTNRFLALLATGFTAGLFLTYLLLDGQELAKKALRLLPPYRRDEAWSLLTVLGERLGRFTLGTLTDMSIVGLSTALGLWVVGLPNALMLGLIIGTFNILPFCGALIGSIPALLIAFGISTQVGLLAVAVILVVQQLEGNLIYPHVVGHVVGLHPVYVFIALAAGTTLWGVPGVFLGIPAAIVIKTLLETWWIPRVERMKPPTVTIVRTEPSEVR